MWPVTICEELQRSYRLCPSGAVYMALAPALDPASAPAAPGLKISLETDHAGALASDVSPDSVTMVTDGGPSAAKGHVEEPAPEAGFPPPGRASAPDEPPVFEPNLRVLVADDAMMNRRLLRRAFTSYFG